MLNMAQVFMSDERFVLAVDATVSHYTNCPNLLVREIVDPARLYLEWHYCQQRPLAAIARQLHCSQRTLRRYYMVMAHHSLYQHLRVQAPDLARLFWRCVGSASVC